MSILDAINVNVYHWRHSIMWVNDFGWGAQSLSKEEREKGALSEIEPYLDSKVSYCDTCNFPVVMLMGRKVEYGFYNQRMYSPSRYVFCYGLFYGCFVEDWQAYLVERIWFYTKQSASRVLRWLLEWSPLVAMIIGVLLLFGVEF